ncbi:MAG: M3 family oligoendopeptidase [Anaerolineaceae bacterium]|nr:M3 family oligoendopeptidase [Anaerolineaceae bacterium]
MADKLGLITPDDLIKLGWVDFESYYTALEKTNLTEGNIEKWLKEWTLVSDVRDELYNRLYVATSINTADKTAQDRFNDFIENTYPKVIAAEQKLKKKLLASSLSIPGFEIPLRNMQAEANLFREENLPLFVEEEKLSNAHDRVIGAQTVQWNGVERTVRQMEVVLRETNRAVRRAGWEQIKLRQLADREEINEQWVRFMKLRAAIAKNANLPEYRSYRWQSLMRFDYTPDDCKLFHNTIEDIAVPAVERIMERRKTKLGVDSLRYYDLFVDLSGKPPLKPFSNIREMKNKISAIFHHVHPDFGAYFDKMDTEGLLDLDNRKSKAAGGYCVDFSYSKRPFIFANVVGIHDDVQTLLHEGGHSIHAFESFKLPYFQQRNESAIPMEFAEVASMAMEYLASPYLNKDFGGFYNEAEAARAKVDHIETDLRFWPYMAIVDAFQHWAYEHPDKGKDPNQCDIKWAELEDRFRPYIDWDGYEDVKMTGWQRKDHIHQMPFYYIEYGIALIGAIQVWKNSLNDPVKAVADYRRALALGGTVTLPKLFETAGAHFAFDASTLQQCVELMVSTIAELERTY